MKNSVLFRYVLFISTLILFGFSATACFKTYSSYVKSVKPLLLEAVGRASKLGELYDARSDQFLSISLFKNKLANVSISQTSNRETRLKYLNENSLTDKFSALDVSAEFKLSALFGLISVKGSGHYLKDTKRSARSTKASLVQSFSTIYEEISITDDDIVKLVNADVLQQIEATHVVVGVQWGGRVMVSVEDTNIHNEDKQTVEGSLGFKLKVLGGLIGGSVDGKISLTDEERREMNKFDFKVYGDVMPKTVPLDLVEAIEFMKNSPTLVTEANGGKGKELTYKLIPVSLLQKLWRVNLGEEKLLVEIEKETIEKCVQLFDYTNLVEQHLNDLVSDVQSFEPYIEMEKVDNVKHLQTNFNEHKIRIKENLSKLLLSVRSGEASVDKLEEAILQSSNDTYSPDNVLAQMEHFVSLKNEMSFLRLMSMLNVTILEKNTLFQQFLWENFNKDVYVMFYNFDQLDSLKMNMNQFRLMLQNRTQFGPNALFALVNIKILETDPNVVLNPKISLYRKGICLVDKYKFNNNTQTIELDDIQQKHSVQIEEIRDLKKKIYNQQMAILNQQIKINEQQKTIQEQRSAINELKNNFN